MNKILGRYPVAIVEALGAVLTVLIVFGANISGDQNAALLAFASAVLTAVASFGLSRDRFLPILMGVFKTAFAVAVLFGVDLSVEQVASTLVALNLLLGLFLPPQVEALYGPEGERRHKTHVAP